MAIYAGRGRHKANLTEVEFCKEIATLTGLNRKQVKSVFQAFRNILDVQNENIELYHNDSIVVPFLGRCDYQRRLGKKAGEVRKVPTFKKGEILEKVLEQDEPDYYRLRFQFKPKMQTDLKENVIKWHNANLKRELNKKIEKINNEK